MNPIALSMLGLAPFAPSNSKGQKHFAEARSRFPFGAHDHESCMAAAERREMIACLCRHEPLTELELMDALNVTRDTISKDLRVLVESGRVKKRMHKAENLYWVQQ